MPSAELRRAVAVAALLLAQPAAAAGPDPLDRPPFDRPLTDAPADPARGRAIVVDRQKGLCLLCHTGPFPEQRFQGNLAPDLAGAGTRLSVPELRRRLVDPARDDPDSIMPSYFRTEGLTRVAPSFRGRPILNAGEIEDVVAFLATLK